MQLPTKNVLQRSICHIFPLKCNMCDTKVKLIVNEHAQQRKIDNAMETQTQVDTSKRKAAMEVRFKIYAQDLTNE